MRPAHPPGVPVRRPPTASHLHEADLVRAVTCAAVVAVHALGTAQPLVGTAPAVLAAGALTTLLHYSREAFMILMGLVLIRTHRAEFDALSFYGRRLVGRLVPYAAFTALYLALPPGHGFAWGRLWPHLILGDASYQLYFMVVAAQFYVALPVLLAFLRRRPRRHVALLLAALAWQVAWYVLVSPWLPHHSVGAYSLGFLAVRSLFTYPFFFVLGALAGWHLDTVGPALRRRARLVTALTLASVLIVLVRYVVVAVPLGRGPAVASSVFEPVMIPYACLLTASLWLAGGTLRGATWAGARAVRRTVAFVARSSFGVYLVHVAVLRWARPLLPHSTSPFFEAALLLGVAFALSLAIAGALGSVPVVRGLLGLAGPARASHRAAA